MLKRLGSWKATAGTLSLRSLGAFWRGKLFTAMSGQIQTPGYLGSVGITIRKNYYLMRTSSGFIEGTM